MIVCKDLNLQYTSAAFIVKVLLYELKIMKRFCFNLPCDVDKMIYNPRALDIFLGRIDEDNYLC